MYDLGTAVFCQGPFDFFCGKNIQHKIIRWDMFLEIISVKAERDTIASFRL
jgi:hypothetical protein